MRSLIYANMTRLRKSRLFWTGILVSLLYSVFLLIMNYRELAVPADTAVTQLDWYLLSPFSIAGAFVSVFCGIFLGTEYSDGTIRNKLTAGHTRTHIYVSNLITVFGAGFLFYAAGCIPVPVLGAALFGWNVAYPVRLALYTLSGILMLAAFAGVFTLPAMLIDNRAFSAASSMVVYILFFIAVSFMRTAVFAGYQTAASPGAPGGARRLILEFFYDFLPMGQSFQISSGLVLHPLRLSCCALADLVLAAACGAAVFKRKDLR